jgi:hypothetical protein
MRVEPVLFDPGRASINEVGSMMTTKAFRHLASTGVACAQEE